MTSKTHLEDGLLPGLPADLIRERYATAPGNEIESGKFQSPESSAALAANAFGYFIDKPEALPTLPIEGTFGWSPLSVQLEVENRFPWRGGRHPWLDVMIETPTTLIGIESKRYEPFRTKAAADLSDAYWRPVWGDAMAGYCRVRDGLRDGTMPFERLDAAQLFKHAFGLRTAVHRAMGPQGKRPVLVYLFAEPATWPDGRPVADDAIAAHRRDIATFKDIVEGDEVAFHALSYRKLLTSWLEVEDVRIHEHARAVEEHFAP